MKTIFTTALLIMMVVFFTSTSKTFAAGNDTLTVFANDQNSLDEIINSDTTTSGMQAHSAYKLVSLDTTYLYLGAVTVKSNLTVVGVPGSDGRLPCIQPGTLSDGSMPELLFDLNGTGIKGVFKNFYIFELSINGSWDWGRDFLVSADSVKLYLDNVIVDENRGEVIAYTGLNDSFFLTNCKFRNGVYPSNWFSSIVLTADYPTSNAADTVVMKYCTFFCINSCAVSPGSSGPLKYLDFSHNSVVYTFIEPLNAATVLSAKINNNIFYGAFACGGDTKIWLPTDGAMIALDTVDANTDLTRSVEVKNNVYFQPKTITDFWTAWNDTATVDSIHIPSFMNIKTTGMFNDKTKWPGFNESGNLVDVDPGYGSSFSVITENTTGSSTVSLLQYIAEIKLGTITTDDWGYKQQVVSGDNWIPEWPLPEATDMKYSNTALKTGATDGLPIGDPNWFGIVTSVAKTTTKVPTTFSLSNAYPNPFNPTTNIQFNIAKSENVKLIVFNILGQQIKTLVNGEMKAGSYTATWNGKDEFGTQVASGIYLYRLESKSFNSTKKMILMK